MLPYFALLVFLVLNFPSFNVFILFYFNCFIDLLLLFISTLKRLCRRFVGGTIQITSLG